MFEIGRLDILKQIQSGELTPLQVYDAFRTNDLNRLPTAATLKPLFEAMSEWIAKKECSEAHRRSLGQSLRHLLPAGRLNNCTVKDLPGLLSSLRDGLQGEHPRSFNLARAAAQAFAKTTQGRTSKLWADITNIEVLKVTPQRLKHPLSLTELDTITNKMPWAYRYMVWDMALTGMGPSEYWGNWEAEQFRILVHGTKRSGRERIVPRIHNPKQPSVLYPAFRRALRDASNDQVRPYDLRRTYANYLESAGIPRTRRRLYMGHGARDVTDLYEKHEVDAYIVDDAAKFRAYVFGSTPAQSLKLVEK